jgi:hypothetical protein
LIELDADAATVVSGALVVLAAGWASMVSVRSAALGPRWTLNHLGRARWGALVATAAGVLVAIVVRPLWLGLVAVYVPAALVALTFMMRRNLQRLDRAGGLEPLPADRAAAVVDRARRSLVVGGGVLVGLAGVGLVAGTGGVAWVVAAVGVTVAGNGLIMRPRAERRV